MSGLDHDSFLRAPLIRRTNATTILCRPRETLGSQELYARIGKSELEPCWNSRVTTVPINVVAVQS
jgi:hypothetical protein